MLDQQFWLHYQPLSVQAQYREKDRTSSEIKKKKSPPPPLLGVQPPSGSHQRLTQEGAAMPYWGTRERLLFSPRAAETTISHCSAVRARPSGSSAGQDWGRADLHSFCLRLPTSSGKTEKAGKEERRCSDWTLADAAAFRATPQWWLRYWSALWCTPGLHSTAYTIRLTNVCPDLQESWECT